MIKGFRSFLLRGEIVVIAIGLIVATALSTLIKSFTSNVVNPIINRAQGKQPIALGVQLGAKGNNSTFLNFGNFISDIIYFAIFMAVVYFLIVLPMNKIQARRAAKTAKGEPDPAPKPEDIILLEQIRDLLARQNA